jgi:hypothetical protein
MTGAAQGRRRKETKNAVDVAQGSMLIAINFQSAAQE